MIRYLSRLHRISNYRSISTSFNIDNVIDKIIEKKKFPTNHFKHIRKNEIYSVIGYGPQGRGQSLNLKDNGFNVILGLRKGNSWNKAIEDGWIDGKNLFSIEEATHKGTIIHYLTSDASQIQLWNVIKDRLYENNTLCFSHGFGIVYNNQTNIIPPSNIDVIMVAPKGSGLSVRNYFIEGKGINSSYAIHQDYTGNATTTCIATAFAIGSSNLFETTFEKEVYSDLTGERCVLMGMLQGAFKAQYDVLRENNHSPFEAFNETVEELLISLAPLVHEKGMDWMYSNCSTTAQRGALDWAPRFEKILKPLIRECYDSVKNGNETEIVINSNSKIDYKKNQSPKHCVY